METSYAPVLMDYGVAPDFVVDVNNYKQYLRISKIAFTPSSDQSSLDIIEAENENAETVIYDLLGRRVQNPSKGIYIVNGKKMLIK